MERFVFLTFHKCGSQWIRDVLTSPAILKQAGVQVCLGGGAILHVTSLWPKQEKMTILGPLYNASYQDWLSNSGQGDKALVVLRDPRDLVVSLVHSFTFSHNRETFIHLVREPLVASSDRNKMNLGMLIFYSYHLAFSSWSGRLSTNGEFITTYENVIADPITEFLKMVDFFGWKVSESVVREATERLSFTSRSGRVPGEEDKYSHYRKGITGDWKNYFDRTTGQVFEETFPNLLSSLGLEKDSNWYQSLREKPSMSILQEDDGHASVEIHELRAKLVRASEENTWLKRICDDRQKVIDQLVHVCDERLQLINELSKPKKSNQT